MECAIPMEISSLKNRCALWLLAIPFLAGCSDEAPTTLAGSLASGVAQTVVNTVSKFDIQSSPGRFSVSVNGRLEGDHWDPHGRRYTPHLSLVCSGRESNVRLMFATAMPGMAMPLPARGGLRVGVTRSGQEPQLIGLQRASGSYVLDGGLLLVYELLHTSSITIDAVSADGKPMPMRFDTEGLRTSLIGHDFFCADSWLAPHPPRARVLTTASTPTGPARLTQPQQISMDALRDEVRVLPGVTSTATFDDGTLIVGMNEAPSNRVSAATDRACELLRHYPAASGFLEVHGAEGMNGKPLRISCPK